MKDAARFGLTLGCGCIWVASAGTAPLGTFTARATDLTANEGFTTALRWQQHLGGAGQDDEKGLSNTCMRRTPSQSGTASASALDWCGQRSYNARLLAFRCHIVAFGSALPCMPVCHDPLQRYAGRRLTSQRVPTSRYAAVLCCEVYQLSWQPDPDLCAVLKRCQAHACCLRGPRNQDGNHLKGESVPLLQHHARALSDRHCSLSPPTSSSSSLTHLPTTTATPTYLQQGYDLQRSQTILRASEHPQTCPAVAQC